MDSNSKFLLLALGLGFGLGIGISVVSSRSFSKCVYCSDRDSCPGTTAAERLLGMELLAAVQGDQNSACTFCDFPYFLKASLVQCIGTCMPQFSSNSGFSGQTRILLTLAAHVHLNQLQDSKFIRNIYPTILLSGPSGTEGYHQTLAKTLAHDFQAKLLILDIADLSLKMLKKYGMGHESGLDSSPSSLKNSSSGATQRIINCCNYESWNSGEEKAKDKKQSKRKTWTFTDKNLLIALQEVLNTLAQASRVILLLHDVERLMFRVSTTYSFFHKMLNELSGPIFIIGSRVKLKPLSTVEQVSTSVDEKLARLFPYSIDMEPVKDYQNQIGWTTQLE